MAVWIYAYGKNELQEFHSEKIVSILNKIDIDEVKVLDCIAEISKDRESIEKHYVKNRKQIEDHFYAKSDTEYKEYIESVNYPDIERDKIVDYFISEGVESERKEKEFFDTQYEKFKNGLIKSEWRKGENNIYFNNLGGFREYDGLRVWFLNDLIGVSGPFEIFSVYSRFQNSIKSVYREYFHSLFKQILSAFKSDFILYTHEWAGLDDEGDKGFDLEKLKEQSDWVNTTSSSIHNMSGFYFEEIITKKTNANKT